MAIDRRLVVELWSRQRNRRTTTSGSMKIRVNCRRRVRNFYLFFGTYYTEEFRRQFEFSGEWVVDYTLRDSTGCVKTFFFRKFSTERRMLFRSNGKRQKEIHPVKRNSDPIRNPTVTRVACHYVWEAAKVPVARSRIRFRFIFFFFFCVFPRVRSGRQTNVKRVYLHNAGVG